MTVVVAVCIYDRSQNLKEWIRCWKMCSTQGAELVIVHNYANETDRDSYMGYCLEYGIRYISRQNVGFDIGAFMDVCKNRLEGFPEFDYLLWCTDDALPMRKDFVYQYLKKMTPGVAVAALELSKSVRLHIRTTGFGIIKDAANRLEFPADPITTKKQCYHFEHRGGLHTFLDQIRRMGYTAVQVSTIQTACFWDSGFKKYRSREQEHYQHFPKLEATTYKRSHLKKICITTVFDKNYKEAGKTLFNSIRRHTDCTGIDFKVITADEEVLSEFGNCHFVTEEIKARYRDVQYSKELPVEKYATSWYRYEIFNFTEYDRVICIDSDCICVKDISYLFSDELESFDLISVEDHIVSKCFNKLVPQLERQGLRLANLVKRMSEGKIDIQPALLVANKTIINDSWYKKLLNYANTAPFSYSIDEGVLNDFIYEENLKIKLLPIEWDYQDIYEQVIPKMAVPSDPIIIHCQESKPFKKKKANIDKRMHKYHDLWWKENKPISKTIVAIIIWNRFENLRLWVNCWNQCDKNAELVVVHNLESDNKRYKQLCDENHVTYVPRENKGFDLGAFQDICKERLAGFHNNWDNLIWLTDDCIPMAKDFVQQFLDKLSNDNIPCYEISSEVKTHIRTTGFLVTKDISKKLSFPRDPIQNREDCYEFEHKSKTAFYEQVVSMGKKPVMVSDLKNSPLWDSGVRGYLNLMRKHEGIFTSTKSNAPNIVINSLLDGMAITHKADKSSRFHNYAVKYDKILSPYREAFSSILEIGVAQGQSIRMWADYFTKATIHGADISKASANCVSYSDRIKFHLLDQRSEAQLKNLEQFSPFDLIIEDGNHFWMEQILTFKTLFPYLRSGGIYIVEDTTTSYWKEYKNNPVSAVEYFKSLVDDVHFKGQKGTIPVNPPAEFKDWEKGWHCREDCHSPLPLFDSIQFMNGFIVIYKR